MGGNLFRTTSLVGHLLNDHLNSSFAYSKFIIKSKVVTLDISNVLWAFGGNQT